MITDQDLVYALGIFTGIALHWVLRGILAAGSYFSKPRNPLVKEPEEPTEEPSEVPWWDKTE